jgi:predicted O-methyltransferase YrrM
MPQDRPSFDSTLAELRDIPGWLHDSQAMRLWDIARRIPEDGQIVEIGGFQGRSTIILARAAAEGVAVISIDPYAGNGRASFEWEGTPEEGQGDHLAFHEHLRNRGLSGRVRQLRKASASAHPEVAGEIDLLYVDGSHRYGDAVHDLCNWGARVREGGTMFVHDTYTSVFVTAATYRTLALSPRWRYVGRERSLAEYRRERVRGGARALNLARQLSALPWFARNLFVRALMAVRLERLAVVLGHRPGGGIY